MNKVLLLGDLHFGHKNIKYTKKYFKTELFPYIEENNIKEVICLGDILDKRKTIDFTVLRDLKEFLSFFENNGIHFYTIAGNHDTYYKSTSDIVGIQQLFEDSQYIQIITSPIELEIYNTKFDMIPWINDSNKQEILEFISHNISKDKYLCGHLELAGIDVNGIILQNGQIDIKNLSGYKKVFSGHYHIPSELNNVIYVGTPYELTFADAYRPKRIQILDTDTGDIEDVYTKFKLYEIYNIYSKDDLGNLLDHDFNTKYVKLVIKSNNLRKDDINFYLDRISQKNCDIISLYVKPYENSVESEETEEETSISIFDTIAQYVENDKEVVNKNQVLNILKEIYKAAEVENDIF